MDHTCMQSKAGCPKGPLCSAVELVLEDVQDNPDPDFMTPRLAKDSLAERLARTGEQYTNQNHQYISTNDRMV